MYATFLWTVLKFARIGQLFLFRTDRLTFKNKQMQCNVLTILFKACCTTSSLQVNSVYKILHAALRSWRRKCLTHRARACRGRDVSRCLKTCKCPTRWTAPPLTCSRPQVKLEEKYILTSLHSKHLQCKVQKSPFTKQHAFGSDCLVQTRVGLRKSEYLE